jgi:hypothetical protein
MERVDELRRAATAADAPCPFKGHDGHRLSWRSGGYRNGTEFHGDPRVSFRVSPTYVLEQARDNFIVARELVGSSRARARPGGSVTRTARTHCRSTSSAPCKRPEHSARLRSSWRALK